MTKIEDHAFFDVLLQQFARTTRAADTFWMPEVHSIEDTDNDDGTTTTTESYAVYSVAQDQSKVQVAYGLEEVDADFITAVHGCFPDLVRRLHAALDEADRADRERDEREQQIGRLSLENQELREEISDRSQTEDSLHDSVIELCDEIDVLREQLSAANGVIDSQRSKAADVLWKSERWT